VILVDSSVWIEYFRGTDDKLSATLGSLILNDNRACICGTVLQEVLQGVREEKEHRLLKERLLSLPFYDADKSTFILAADIYRTLRKRGKTVPGADVLIAATAIENHLPLYSLDTAHFNLIAESFKRLRFFTI
jgi:predicted nucleic acid-binding protein